MQLHEYAGGTGKTLDELRNHLANREREYLSVPLSALAVDGDSGNLVYDNFSAPMTHFAADRLSHRVGLQGAFIKRIPTDLAAVNFNRFLPATQGNTQLAIEQIDGNPVIVGVLPEKVSPVPLETLVEHFGNTMPAGFEPAEWRHDDGGLQARFTTQNLVAQPKVGDIIRAGVDLHDFENDTGLLDVTGVMYRLVCGNGQTAPAITFGGKLRKEAWREPHAIVAAAAGYFDEAVKGVSEYIAGIEALPSIDIELPEDGRLREKAVKAAIKLVSITPAFSEAVSQAWRAEEQSAYGFYNSLTRLGRDSRDRTARRKFEKAGFLTVMHGREIAEAVAAVLEEADED